MNDNWCELCRHRQAELDKKQNATPPITADVGWCMPAEFLYADAGLGCYLWPDHSYGYYLHIWGWRHWYRAYRRWRENQEHVGEMVHAFVSPLEFLPEISVQRGGITYGDSK